MFRKAFKRFKRVAKKAKKTSIAPSSSKKSTPLKLSSPKKPILKPIFSSARVLTAEGWMRQMMKNHRKSN